MSLVFVEYLSLPYTTLINGLILEIIHSPFFHMKFWRPNSDLASTLLFCLTTSFHVASGRIVNLMVMQSLKTYKGFDGEHDLGCTVSPGTHGFSRSKPFTSSLNQHHNLQWCKNMQTGQSLGAKFASRAQNFHMNKRKKF